MKNYSWLSADAKKLIIRCLKKSQILIYGKHFDYIAMKNKRGHIVFKRRFDGGPFWRYCFVPFGSESLERFRDWKFYEEEEAIEKYE